jgi:hypothetical protein
MTKYFITEDIIYSLANVKKIAHEVRKDDEHEIVIYYFDCTCDWIKCGKGEKGKALAEARMTSIKMKLG